MNEEYPEFEKELKSLTPMRPSELLKERIALEMEKKPVETSEDTPEPASARRRVIFDWKGIAAALVVTFFGYSVYQQVTQQPEVAGVPDAGEVESAPENIPDVFNPVLAEREVIDKIDEGIVVLDDKGPYRKVRYKMMDHYQWENPRSGRTLTVKQPSEQVIFVGMDMY
ncbi:MAG: hypothetical protein AAF492_33390 [Verrucomicrobiota bacterium]